MKEVLNIDEWLKAGEKQFVFISKERVNRLKDGIEFEVGDTVRVWGISLKNNNKLKFYATIESFDSDCICVNFKDFSKESNNGFGKLYKFDLKININEVEKIF